jgi:hypothetical protein
LKIKKIDSDYFLIKSNILRSERANVNLNKEILKMAFTNIHEILNFNYKMINFLNIMLGKRFKKAHIKGLQTMR